MKTLVQASPELPINLGLLKLHLRIDGAALDGIIKSYAQAAVSEFEKQSGMVLTDSTWEMQFSVWPTSRELRLEVRPLSSVLSVKYWTADGSERVLSEESYEVDAAESAIKLKRSTSWPSEPLRVAAPIIVGFTAGFSDPDLVPADIQTALWFRVQGMALGVKASASTIHALETNRLQAVFDSAVARYMVYR